MPPKCSGKGKSKAPARKRIRQEPDPQQEHSNSSEDEHISDIEEENDKETSKGAEQIDEKICDFFEHNSFFYDLTHESYKDKKRRDSTLAEFASALGSGWTGDKIWSRFKSLRTDYGKIKAQLKKGKSGSGAKKLTQKQQWKLRAFQFLEPYSRKGACDTQDTELGQIPQLSDEDDEDDETPYNDDTLVPPSTSTQTGRVQPKQQGKKTKGSSDLVSVLKEVLQADRGQENDIRKTVQDLGKAPDARQAWAAWFASVCQDVPQELFREFQNETFTVSMRFLQQQQPQQRSMWQPLPPYHQQPIWQSPNAPAPALPGSSQPPQYHHLQLPQQQLRPYTSTQDVQSYTTISLGEMGTSFGNPRSKSAQPSSNIIQQAFNAAIGPTANTPSPVLTSEYQPSPQLSTSQPQQPTQQSTDPGSLSLSLGLSSRPQDSSLE